MAPADIQWPKFQGHSVKLSVINGAKSHMAAEMLVEPTYEGQKFLDLACYSFLIESEHLKHKVLFDLAFMKDLNTRMPPALKAILGDGDDKSGVDEVHDVPDTLTNHGIDLSTVNSIILSHGHIDHSGDPSVFPSSTELVVGSGFKEAYMPGYPTNPNSFALDSAFKDRTVQEVDFSSSKISIGGFRAIDFFDDGSFWLLETPGHTKHHICALCRTTENTWCLLGGDACHNVAQLRPNQYRPLPNTVPASLFGRSPPPENCSCAHMSRLVQHGKGGSVYGLAPGMHEDIQEAETTVEKLKAFEGRDDVLIAIAHDATLLDVLPLFPQAINTWKAEGWADQARWLFLKELETVAAVMT